MKRTMIVRLAVIAVLLWVIAPSSLLAAPAATTAVRTGTLDGETHPWDDYTFFILGGTQVVIDLECTPPSDLDPAVAVTGPGGFSAMDDDSGAMACAQAYSSHLEFVAPETGDYVVRASSYEILIDNDPTDPNADGYYRLTVVYELGLGGCDTRLNLTNAVVGAFVADAPVYAEPGQLAVPELTIAAGKTYWVLGIDASGEYYQIYLQCVKVWVPVSAVGPNYDDVWQGVPLPSVKVE